MITASGSDNSPVASAAVMPKLPVIADTKGRLRVTKAQRRDILAAFGPQRRVAAPICPADGSEVFHPGSLGAVGVVPNLLAESRGCGCWKPSWKRRPRLRSGPVLVLQLPGGVRVEVADEKQAALAAVLVRALAKPC